MGCAEQNERDNKVNRQTAFRMIALSVCIVFISVSLLSATYIFTHVNHAHDRCGPVGNCTTCTNLTAALNLLESLSVAMAVAALAAGSLFAALSAPKPVAFQRGFPTLVCLKVRLNN